MQVARDVFAAALSDVLADFSSRPDGPSWPRGTDDTAHRRTVTGTFCGMSESLTGGGGGCHGRPATWIGEPSCRWGAVGARQPLASTAMSA
jgi:hypothetical protein